MSHSVLQESVDYKSNVTELLLLLLHQYFGVRMHSTREICTARVSDVLTAFLTKVEKGVEPQKRVSTTIMTKWS